jgi:hypothetical protein
MAKRIGKTLADLTPSVIVFHETVNTQVIASGLSKIIFIILFLKLAEIQNFKE